MFIQVESCILVLRGRFTARMSWPTKLNGSVHWWNITQWQPR